MNWLDIAIIILLIISVLLGLRAGFIKSILSLAGLIVGIILAGRYYVPLSEKLTLISSSTIAKVVAFAIILIAVMIIATVIAWLLTKLVSKIMLGWLNHLGGAIFGLVAGAVLVGAVLAVWIRLSGIEGPVTDSRLAPLLLKYFPLVLSLLPGDFRQILSFF